MAAATVSYDVSFSANSFTGIGTPNIPGGTLSGAFQITFDPTLGYDNDTSVISNFSINLPGFGSTPVGLSYTPFLSSGVIGGELGGGDTAFNVTNGTSDFHIAFTLGGLISEITFSAVNTNGHARKYTAWFPQTTVTAATPIPASLVMMLTGLAAFGGFGYLRSRKAAQPEAVSLAA